MKWVAGLGYLLSFIAFSFGALGIASQAIMPYLSPIYRPPTIESILINIGWLLISLFFLALITSLKTGENNTW